MWGFCLPFFPDGLDIETRDLCINVSGGFAAAHWLWRFTGADDHPATQSRMRSTNVYRRTDAGWKVIHEHASIPFDPMTSKVAFGLDI
jgi:ketosteroid isomerase-like protein